MWSINYENLSKFHISIGIAAIIAAALLSINGQWLFFSSVNEMSDDSNERYSGLLDDCIKLRNMNLSCSDFVNSSSKIIDSDFNSRLDFLKTMLIFTLIISSILFIIGGSSFYYGYTRFCNESRKVKK